MGKRGPRKEPTIIKIAKGNPGKRPLNKSEPKPPSDDIAPPEWVTGVAREKWDNVVPKLKAMGVMTNADVDTIARYCTMHEQFVKYLDQCRRGLDVLVIRDDAGKVKYMQSTPAATMLSKLAASMLRIEQEFGLTPSARSGLSATQGQQQESVIEKFRRLKAASETAG
jgi:P27 family predicted phage terminase small subunit